jgi:L-lactate dehydrogenase complex protein LldG
MNRDAILSKIRSALASGTRDAAAGRSAVLGRIKDAPRGLIPEIARLSGPEAVEAFCTRATAQGATVLRAGNLNDVPGTLAAYLTGHQLPLLIRTGPHSDVEDIPWQAARIAVQTGAAGRDDVVGLSVAAAGIAETGTIVLASHATNPASVAFLPETHIVLLRCDDVVGSLEDGFDRVRATSEPNAMPRSINLITGPSRTGDIGGRIVHGAHGPRRLCVVVIG